MSKLDQIDRQILTLMQDDASLPIQQIADQVGLSVNPCWRRIRQMEAGRRHPGPRRPREPGESGARPHGLRAREDA